MNPEDWLRSICELHGLPHADGAGMIPLVRRAMSAPAAVREQILALVAGNLAERAAGGDGDRVMWRDVDQGILLEVARVLHAWAPTKGLFDEGRDVPEGLPEGL